MDEVNNATRAQWAMDVISQDAARHGTENDQQSLSDLLNNIMHLAAARKNVYFVAALILAKMHLRDEYVEQLQNRTIGGL